MSKTFVFYAKNSSIIVSISADNQDDALAEIREYFDDNGTEDLRSESEEGLEDE